LTLPTAAARPWLESPNYHLQQSRLFVAALGHVDPLYTRAQEPPLKGEAIGARSVGKELLDQVRFGHVNHTCLVFGMNTAQFLSVMAGAPSPSPLRRRLQASRSSPRELVEPRDKPRKTPRH
jgi:hypothetical protein